MKSLGDAIMKYLGDKKEMRWFVEETDLLDVLTKMGFENDDQSLESVLEYIEKENIYIEPTTKPLFNEHITFSAKLKSMESARKLRKRLKKNNANFKKLANVQIDKNSSSYREMLNKFKREND